MSIFGHHEQDEYSRIYGSSKRDIRDDLGWRVYDSSYEDIYEEDGDVAMVPCDNCD